MTLTRFWPEIITILWTQITHAATLMQGAVPYSTGTAVAELVFS